MSIFFGLIALLIVVGLVMLISSLVAKPKVEQKQDYGYVQGTAHNIIGSSNVVPGAYRRSRNW